jgi:argininosuccinate lyase
MKGQPLAYNRDNQEDKLALFDSVDTTRACLQAFTEIIPAVDVKRENLLATAIRGYTTATDLADYLVRKGVTFRDAHEIVGKTVQFAIDKSSDLSELSLEQLQQFSDAIDSDVYTILELNGSVNARDHIGGTAPTRVQAAIKMARKTLK